MTHFIRKCSCGNIIAQCRCPSNDKAVEVVKNGCEDCKNRADKDINVPIKHIASGEFTPLKHELYKLVDAFLVEAKDQNGHNRSLSQLNQDRHLFVGEVIKLFDDREEVMIDNIRKAVEDGLQLMGIVHGGNEMEGRWINVEDVLAVLPAPRGNRTLCYFCHKPIHISKLAGFFGGKNQNHAFCNNTLCLIAFTNWEKENSIQDTDFKAHDLSVANENTEGL